VSITTHILDTSRGKPAGGVAVTLEARSGDRWRALGAAETDADGRARSLLPAGEPLVPGEYRLRFAVGAYFERLGTESFFPSVEITFVVREAAGSYHVPLLLSPFGFSTYRGS
jgi:5-hydroxyisourate hydrolase